MYSLIMLIVEFLFVVVLAIVSVHILSTRMRAFLRSGVLVEYHDRDYRPADRSDLPAAARDHFERLTPEMEAAGLTAIGDFHDSQPSQELYIRCFAVGDGRLFGMIEYWKLGLLNRRKTFSFSSVFEDGTYFESGPVRPPEVRGESARLLHFEGMPCASVRQLYEFHRERTAAYAEQYGTQLRSFAPEQFAEVSNYGHQLVYWSLHKQGYSVQPPPSAKQEEPEPVAAAEQ